jgi:hypothetical protein
VEVSDTRLRLVHHRDRTGEQFERADVRTLELDRQLDRIWISTPTSYHRHVIYLHNVAPRRVARLVSALDRHGWLQPDPDRATA